MEQRSSVGFVALLILLVMRITHIRGCYRLDLSGITCLRIASEIH
jgi:hypothetical protein